MKNEKNTLDNQEKQDIHKILWYNFNRRYAGLERDKWEKIRDDTKYQRKVLESILVTASKDNKYMLPTEGKFILGELVNGVIDSLGGRGGRAKFNKDLVGLSPFSFEDNIWEYYSSQIVKAPKKLHPKIKEVIG